MTTGLLFRSKMAEVEALKADVSSLTVTPDDLAALTWEMRLLTALCSRYPGEVQSLWDSFQREQPSGSPDRFRPFLGDMLDLIDGRLLVTRLLRKLAKDIMDLGGTLAEGEAPLLKAQEELQIIRDRLADLWQWMNAPPSALGSMVEECRAARARGEGEEVRDLLERFQTSGRLSSE